MNLRTFAFIGLGFFLKYVSGAVELMGDLAPGAKEGVAAERLTYHLAALVLLIAAFASFAYGGLCAWRSLRAR